MDMFKLIATIAELAAKAGAGSASLAGCHQPAEPQKHQSHSEKVRLFQTQWQSGKAVISQYIVLYT